MTKTVLKVTDLVRHYPLPKESLFAAPRFVYALNGVSFEIKEGSSFGIVGESGCGKSTLARNVMALEDTDSGSVEILGNEVVGKSFSELRPLREHFQMVFQDPYGSLDPHHTVGRIVAEPLTVIGSLDKAEKEKRVAEVLSSVGLKPTDAEKYPHEFSGGQRQRIAIARALITRPSLIVADEPVSALDVSVQAQVLNLLRDLQDEFGVTYMFISHDLAVVEYLCDEMAVMYLGSIVEKGRTEDLYANPAHPYTRILLDAVPNPAAGKNRKRIRLDGGVTGQTEKRNGCAFQDRCPMVEDRCRRETPTLSTVKGDHLAACHFSDKVKDLGKTA
ncbi:ATP-binding cassette domain-containing protein [Sneathiella sp. P13V-1]|uniref:ABC transporter ATP-binding protein n=1 Tax=Sneathiella sp. P13V-1 TaxID=2697366 RepID=UPI00187BAC88|nr:oligopeptide/dipeptide ABC transporter ATP-binding protein [Sneathiella sp. P13V-1]MBE7636452.1 ATP-binding cassette domain-containing protein [Sneathiella sp. P13V-1]